ncbi:hypothetical protein NKJ72_28495 [Mesorhizobium sp. M0045]|uniref:hypothetical protein n=1 Tax=Mesorhizobium sp. M0045 TaxID=2956857 RepID=UPI0033387A7B
MPAATLDAFLNSYLGEPDELRSAVVATIRQLTQAATTIRNTINQGMCRVSMNCFFGLRRAIRQTSSMRLLVLQTSAISTALIMEQP